MKKLLFVSLLFITLSSCQKNEENTEAGQERITIKELISAVENNNNVYLNKTFKITANFKFSHPLAECLGECNGSKQKEDYEVTNEYLFKDFHLCYNKTEIVFQDNEENKITILNFPKYKIAEEYDSTLNNELNHFIENIEIEAKVLYNQTFNYCKETKHPSLYLELSDKNINEIFNSIENIILSQ
ncbi:hypothetical protein [Tenacibaculum jejuense]|uniref:Lipoprotein n=1 Tax=Tenacibaculum jejuense TaxID=584609 RepID=A0A238U4Z6_9FLAO|nr:hypothetical protein [Tenacibaculum jejuense]SNR14162.1 protein of unknown function [Tenacibaculum jejuense]